MHPIPAQKTRKPAAAARQDMFRLNLSYLLTVRQRVASGAKSHAEIVLGLEEPLASWLRCASIEAVATLARSPALTYEPRLPETSVERILSASEGASARQWLAAVHLAMSCAEASHEPAR